MSFDLAQFQLLLCYKFSNDSLLAQALTHKSYCVDKNKDKPHNERLEFLGDSILNFVIAEKLISLYPEEAEGVLSKKRAALVNLTKLAQISAGLKLEQNMLFGPGEVKQGSHLNPRLHGSCLEALIGAIYLDSDYAQARNWVLNLFKETDYLLSDQKDAIIDYKSRLQELTQKFKLGTPMYELVLATGPSHKPQFLVALMLNNEEKSRAESSTKKNAEQKAAQIYYNELIKVYHE